MTVHDAVEKAHEQEAIERAHLRAKLKEARLLLYRTLDVLDDVDHRNIINSVQAFLDSK